MIWNAAGECPFCNAPGAVGWSGGPINTRSGNLSYQETDFVIPVAGRPLEFRRSYASNATDFYTTTLGFGWTHNYDMRLHFANTATAISDTVELQAPGGSRLPFFIDQPGSFPDSTYTPYPGVTAQLSYDTGTAEYLVTGFEQSTYRFDSQGQLLAQIDASGNAVSFSYDANGRLQRAAQSGRYLDFGYFPDNRLQTVTDNLGRAVSMAYNGDGDLTFVTNPLGKMSSYEYNSATPHKLTKATDPSGRVAEETAYDDDGRAFQQWDGAGNQLVDISYAITGTHVVTENSVVMTHTYDSRNTLVDTIFTCVDGTPGCGANVDTGYDDNFKTNSVTDANNNAASLSWNAGGSNLESVTNALNQTTSMAYDAYNNPEQVTDARGNATGHTYHPTLTTFRTSTTDDLGHTARYTPTLNTLQNGVTVPDGLLLEQQDSSGIVTSYEYNEFGQVLKVTAGVGSSQPLVTNYVYDGIGRLSTTTQVSGAGNITSLNAYDNGDRLVAAIDNWTGSDPANWLANCDTSPGARDTNVCTRFFYDDAGRTTAVTNTLGQTDLSFYDAAGRFSLSVSNYDGATYDPANPEAALCNFSSPDPEHNICGKTEYDSNGRVFRTTDSLGQLSLTLYDSLGRVAGIIQNSVNVTSLAQCSFVKERADSDQDLCTVYTYDSVGNVLITKDPAGNQTRTFYDALNRAAGQIANWSGAMNSLGELEASCFTLDPLRETDICTTSEYDEVGNVILTTDPKGQQTRTTYNDV
ncbi:MAG: hypothetical protein GWP17_05960, partial [Aquificales bacterium]|nr:hypothetical protein [Aquificales bacterium]